MTIIHLRLVSLTITFQESSVVMGILPQSLTTNHPFIHSPSDVYCSTKCVFHYRKLSKFHPVVFLFGPTTVLHAFTTMQGVPITLIWLSYLCFLSPEHLCIHSDGTTTTIIITTIYVSPLTVPPLKPSKPLCKWTVVSDIFRYRPYAYQHH